LSGKNKDISIAASRKALRADLKKKAAKDSIKRTIQFRNNDVPVYLAKLSQLEERSRKVRIVVD
jgi:hypothetical protein